MGDAGEVKMGGATMVGLEEWRHEAGECFDRVIVVWRRRGHCGDPRCKEAFDGRRPVAFIGYPSAIIPIYNPDLRPEGIELGPRVCQGWDRRGRRP